MVCAVITCSDACVRDNIMSLIVIVSDGGGTTSETCIYIYIYIYISRTHDDHRINRYEKDWSYHKRTQFNSETWRLVLSCKYNTQ
jgi:hypothetical protein